MIREEANSLLNVTERSTEQEIREKFNELYNDYQIRLTNAPTPNLKKLYQKNLQELKEARAVLLPDAVDKEISDLPSSSPVFSKASEQAPTNPNFNPIQNKKATKPQAKKNTGAIVAIIILSALSVLLLAATVFLGIINSDTAKETEILKKGVEEGKVTAAKLTHLQSQFSNHKFKIKNDGANPITIHYVIVVYSDKEGKLVKYYEGEPKTINPNSVSEFSKVSANRSEWDGSVISYTFKVSNINGESVWSGIWSMEMLEDKMLHLNLDEY